jgi:VanZ family protein
MLPLRHARRWRLASIILLTLVLLAALIPAAWFWPDSGDLVTWLVHADKWAHGLTFALLAIWFSGQYRRRSYWRIATGLIAFGMLIEAFQAVLSYRSAEWLDMVADVTGIVIGLGVALAGLGGWSVWVENRLGRNRVEADVG